jgi:hypothetical protein
LQGWRWEAKPRLIFRRKVERGKTEDGDKLKRLLLQIYCGLTFFSLSFLFKKKKKSLRLSNPNSSPSAYLVIRFFSNSKGGSLHSQNGH